MRLFDKTRLRLRSLFGRRHVETELSEEFQFHLDRLTEQNRSAGLTPADARQAALRELGGLTQLQEECRDARGVNMIETLLQDVRYGLRMLRRNPGFSAVAILSLALGIGANTAIFTLINALTLKPLPVAKPRELVQIQLWTPRGPQTSLSFYALEFFRSHPELFAGVFVQAYHRFDVEIGGQTAPIEGAYVPGDYFPTLGVAPIMGRWLSPPDDQESGGVDGPTAVLSYRFWMARFAGDRSVLGSTIVVEGTPVVIVGVMPAAFFGVDVGRSPNIFVPLRLEPMLEKDRSELHERAAWWLGILARKKAGVTDAEISAGLSVLWPRFLSDVLPRDKERVRAQYVTLRLEAVDVSRGTSGLRRQFSQPLYILMGIVGLVLLIACANVANLLLARTSARQHEVAVRLALGASRPRLVRQLLTESVMLSTFGAALGIAFAFWGCRLLLSILSTSQQSVDLNIWPDPLVLGFTALVAIMTGVVFGTAPSLRATRGTAAESLKDNSQRATHRAVAANILVVAQVALCLVLLIGAGLFVRTFWNLMHQDLGYDRDNLYVASIDPRPAGYKNDSLTRLYDQLFENLNRNPNVQSASLSMTTPIGRCCWFDPILAEGFTENPGEGKDVYLNRISPGFFKTFGTRMLLGHDFTTADGPNAPLKAIVSESIVKHYFAGQSPIGKHISVAGEHGHQNAEIIGVVEDMRTRGLREQIEYEAYFNMFQESKPGDMIVEIRTAKGLASAAALLRGDVQAFNRQIPVNMESFSEQISQTALKDRMTAILAGFFGCLALLLASIGLYGIMSYTVVRRTGELGIRMALGAQATDVTWMILRETLWLAGTGAALGIPAALGCTRLLTSVSTMLFGLEATDPVTIAGTTLLLIVLAGAAGYIPARRAAHLDPVIALRNE
jgi:putative ABC transport system permease protein